MNEELKETRRVPAQATAKPGQVGDKITESLERVRRRALGRPDPPKKPRDDARSSIKMFFDLYLEDFMRSNPGVPYKDYPEHIGFLMTLQKNGYPQNIYVGGNEKP